MFQKSSLALLTDYGGDSSDDEVPGPRVSTKRSFKDEDNEDYPEKRFERLPVPELFTKVPKTDEHIDDSSLHHGRIRSFPHQRGNWATFVYVPFASKKGIAQLLSSIQEIIPKDLGVRLSDDFHISLTKTVILKYHWIPSFVKTLKENLECFKKFYILFDSIKVYCNEERTRTFLGMQIKSGHDSLLKLVETLDRCLEEYELPPFYTHPSFHMSIAWCVGDVEQELQSYIPQINNKLDHLMGIEEQDEWYIFAHHLLCKIGNKHFQFMLS